MEPLESRSALLFVEPEPVSPFYVIFCVVIVLETAHLFSPLLLASSSGPLRQIILKAPGKHIVLPLAALCLGLIAPFRITSLIFYWWNIYHFGMQNYGVLALWRGRQPRYVKWTCVIVTAGGMVAPIFLHSQFANIAAFIMFSVTHWLTDIGLSAWRSRSAWGFVIIVLLLGTLGFVWFQPHDHGYHRRSQELTQFVMSLSFIHFLYSGWLWKMSDPQVRATIGRNLLSAAQAGLPRPA
jgi:hypothetical protein